MTDPTSRPDDELVSAVLDGEATADERARVEADPAARARLAELRAVRDLVAAPVPVPAAGRERAITAALEQFDVAVTDGGGEAGPGRTTTATGDRPRTDPAADRPDELAARRSRRGGGGRWLAAAAAIVVVVLGAAAVIRSLNPPAEVTAASSQSVPSTTAAAAGAADGEAGPNPPSNAVPGGPVTSTSSPAATTTLPTNDGAISSSPDLDPLAFAAISVDLGDLTTPRQLRDRMLGLVDARAADAAGGAPATTDALVPDAGAELAGFATCASYLDAIDPELDQLLAVGAATYQGRPATVLAFSIDQAAHPAANGSIRIYAVDPTSCATVSVLTTR